METDNIVYDYDYDYDRIISLHFARGPVPNHGSKALKECWLERTFLWIRAVTSIAVFWI